MDVIILLIGLGLLIFGGELVVTHGVRIAEYLHISPLIIGLTVVAVGTSLPELAVGIEGMREGVGDIVLGNMAGTDVVNVLLILGLSALIRPLAVPNGVIKFDLPMMTLSSVLFLVLAWWPSSWFSADHAYLSRWNGAFLLLCGLAYMAVTVITARRRGSAKVAKNIDETSTDQNYALHHPEKVKEKVTRKAALISTGLLVIGLAAIIWGADLMLDGAVRIAIDLGISETLVGLTVVAIGTSAPELVTTIIATIKDERSLAFGNLIGSSTLNLTIILGTALLFTPHAIAVNPKLIQFSVPFMIATGLVCIPVFMSGKRISRVEGGLFVAAYGIYLAYTIANA